MIDNVADLSSAIGVIGGVFVGSIDFENVTIQTGNPDIYVASFDFPYTIFFGDCHIDGSIQAQSVPQKLIFNNTNVTQGVNISGGVELLLLNTGIPYTDVEYKNPNSHTHLQIAYGCATGQPTSDWSDDQQVYVCNDPCDETVNGVCVIKNFALADRDGNMVVRKDEIDDSSAVVAIRIPELRGQNGSTIQLNTVNQQTWTFNFNLDSGQLYSSDPVRTVWLHLPNDAAQTIECNHSEIVSFCVHEHEDDFLNSPLFWILVIGSVILLVTSLAIAIEKYRKWAVPGHGLVGCSCGSTKCQKFGRSCCCFMSNTEDMFDLPQDTAAPEVLR